VNSIKKLNSQNIIHLDIKEKNIMYDRMIHNPIIIDFGISFDCTSPATSDIFYTDIYYPYWCIDIYIICDIIAKERQAKIIVKEELDELIKRFFVEFFETSKKFIVPVKEEEKAPIIENHIIFFSSFIGKTYKELQDHLYSPEYYLSWDLYSLCITYLFIRFTDNEENLQETPQQTQPQPQPQTQPQTQPQPPPPPKLKDILHKIIRANPKERIELINVNIK
jgi:serine/threonine protein kinase